MKALYFFLAALLLHSSLMAQWGNDPTNPTVVSQEENTQHLVQSQPDGQGGLFVFWRDTRMDLYKGDIYGQHYNSEGVAQWEEGGKEIFDYSGNIYFFRAHYSTAKDELIIGCINTSTIYQDSVMVQKLDVNGDKVWENDLMLAQGTACTEPYYILNITDFDWVERDNDYVLAFIVTYCGGAGGTRITSFGSDGIAEGPFQGAPLSGGWATTHLCNTYDGSDDVIQVYSAGNGAGAHAWALRADATGSIVWGPIDIMENTSGLNYKLDAQSDANGFKIMWEGSGTGTGIDIIVRSFDFDAVMQWENIVCSAEGSQERFFWKQKNDMNYIVWADGRPGVVGNYAMYAQKFSDTGVNQWTEDGVEVADLNTYIPYPKLELDSDNNILVCHAPNFLGTRIHKMNDEGVVLNPGEGDLICEYTFSQSYGDYDMNQTGDKVVVAWVQGTGQGSDGIYMGCAGQINGVVEVSEVVTSCNSYTINGVTYDQSGIYAIELPGDTLLTLDLTINSVVATTTLNGNTLTAGATDGDNTWIDCSNNQILSTGSDTFTPTATGEYALVVALDACADTSACTQITIITVEEWGLKNSIQVWPNPVKNVLNIQSNESLKNATLTLTDLSGSSVVQKKSITGNLVTEDVSGLASGIYIVNICNDNVIMKIKWIKE